MCNNKDSNCMAEILKVIFVLQQNADCSDACLDACDRGFLGCGPTNCCNFNTRPIMLYTCCGNGTAWSMPTTKSDSCTGPVEGTSCVFRVEKLDENCATFRVLEANPETGSLYPYVATNSFFTMNLDCVCCLRCLNDTYVECI